MLVGATSGIGEATLKSFIQHTDSPTAYVVGRSETAASRIISECSTLNKDAKVAFIKANVSELREVDRVCNDVLSREKHLNLLVQTQGNLNFRGRDGKSPDSNFVSDFLCDIKSRDDLKWWQNSRIRIIGRIRSEANPQLLLPHALHPKTSSPPPHFHNHIPPSLPHPKRSRPRPWRPNQRFRSLP